MTRTSDTYYSPDMIDGTCVNLHSDPTGVTVEMSTPIATHMEHAGTAGELGPADYLTVSVRFDADNVNVLQNLAQDLTTAARILVNK